MSDVRLYMFQCGTLSLPLQVIKLGQTPGELFRIRVQFYVIAHPKGHTIIDGETLQL